MVTIIPSYVYSIFAALVVCAIIVSSCSLSAANIKNEAQNQQLANVDEYVAAQGLTLVTYVSQDGQNTTQFLNLPSQIGNQEYSISLTNDSRCACIESGFGATVRNQPRMCIPAKISASGTFISGWGKPLLQCCIENQTITLTLSDECD